MGAAIAFERIEGRKATAATIGVLELAKVEERVPSWLEVRTVREAPANAFPVTLHRWERETILWAETLGADILLIDEQIRRTIALSRNLPLSGTLGVLERADMLGLVATFRKF